MSDLCGLDGCGPSDGELPDSFILVHSSVSLT